MFAVLYCASYCSPALQAGNWLGWLMDYTNTASYCCIATNTIFNSFVLFEIALIPPLNDYVFTFEAMYI